MSRGRNHDNIFHDQRFFNAFLKCLQEASEQFDAVIHAYCLMSNHYHLLIETPKANLGRIMRHVNGVYTQRYNCLNKTDGPLFKGRYKSVLVDEDRYLLQLTRYIHLNPIDTKPPMVNDLLDYEWSSYPAYVNQVKAPEWLYREKTYQMLGHKQRYKGYQTYISQGVDEDLKRYYSRFNVLSVLGSAEFKEGRKEFIEAIDLDEINGLNNKPATDEIIKLICEYAKTQELSVRSKPKGKRPANPIRAFAMYACRRYGDSSQKDLAEAFELQHLGSAAFSINKVKKEILAGEWRMAINWLENKLDIVKSA
jgi:putative transposase